MVKNKTLARRGLLVLALGNQSSHLPGNSFRSDYIQYVVTNNHTALGLFCFNDLHPIRSDIRIFSLAASFLLSFAAFNYLYFYFETLGKVPGTSTLVISAIGAVIMAVLDFILWFYVALPCCLPGHSLAIHSKSRWIGKYVIFSIAILLCTSSFFLVLGNDGADAGVETCIIGGLALFMVAIFVYRIIVASAIFLWIYKRDYDFYEEQLKSIGGDEKNSDEDEVEESDYSVQERDIEGGSRNAKSKESSVFDHQDESDEESDGDSSSDGDDVSEPDGDYSTDED